MSENTSEERWIWVIIENPGKEERITGQHDNEKDLDYIPAFLSKEEAEKGYHGLSLKPGSRYEPQAIMLEELVLEAKQSAFQILIIDANGKVLENIS